MQTFKRLKTLGVVIVIAILLNALLSYMLVPVYGSSNLMWSEYKKEKDLNVVFVGSSLCQRNINPNIIQEETNLNCFNMGTSAQSLYSSTFAVDHVLKEHKLDYVVLLLDYSGLVKDQNMSAEVAFTHAYIDQLNKGLVKDSLGFMLDPTHVRKNISMNYVFPWIYNHVPFTKAAIIKNINQKKNHVSCLESELENMSGKEYLGKGCEVYLDKQDYNAILHDVGASSYGVELDQAKFEQLDRFLKVCKSHEVPVLVINSPKTLYNIYSYGDDYYRLKDEMETYFENNQIPYYDFSFAKKELFDSKESYYFDKEHLNKEGNLVFSKSVGTLLKLHEEKKNVSHLFYTNEEFKQLDLGLAGVDLDGSIEDDGIVLHAKAYKDASCKVLYSYWILNKDSNKYERLDKQTDQDTYKFVPNQKGIYSFKVEVCNEINHNEARVATCDIVY